MNKKEIKALLEMGAIDDPEYYNSLTETEKEEVIKYWVIHYDDDINESEVQ